MADPLPTSANPAPLNVNLVPSQGFNLNVLNQALANNSITQEDLLKAARNPDLVALQQAQSASQIQDLQTLPIRRQQEMDAAKQNAVIRNLQIQAAQENLKDLLDPSRPIQRQVNADQVKQFFATHGTDIALPATSSELVQENVKTQLALAARDRAIKAAENAALERNKKIEADHLDQFAELAYLPNSTEPDYGTMQANLKGLGGKAAQVPQDVSKQLVTLDEMQKSVNTLKPLFEQRGGGWWNIASGTFMKLNPIDANRSAIDAELGIITPRLISGLLGEGTKAAGSVNIQERQKALLPSVTQSPEIFKDRLDRLDNEIATARESLLREQELARHDVSRFRKAGPGVLPYPGMTPPAAGTTPAPPAAAAPTATPTAAPAATAAPTLGTYANPVKGYSESLPVGTIYDDGKKNPDGTAALKVVRPRETTTVTPAPPVPGGTNTVSSALGGTNTIPIQASAPVATVATNTIPIVAATNAPAPPLLGTSATLTTPAVPVVSAPAVDALAPSTLAPAGGPANLTAGPSDVAPAKDIPVPLVPGNIGLKDRPVVKNKDGSISTLLSTSFTDDQGRVILVPLISRTGIIWDPKEAWANYLRTGQQLGIFKTVAEATRYAQLLSQAQGQYYKNRS